eukprot:scaffold1992_cov103-Isochrysis_galbana.AAC.2
MPCVADERARRSWHQSPWRWRRRRLLDSKAAADGGQCGGRAGRDGGCDAVKQPVPAGDRAGQRHLRSYTSLGRVLGSWSLTQSVRGYEESNPFLDKWLPLI